MLKRLQIALIWVRDCKSRTAEKSRTAAAVAIIWLLDTITFIVALLGLDNLTNKWYFK